MDGLSVASGVIAVVSLAAQVGSGIKKLCDFWDSVKDCPKDVRTIAKQLNIISHIVDGIREEASTLQAQSRALSPTHAALGSCAESIQTLEEMIVESQRGLVSRKKRRRTWAAIKFAWNGDKLKKYQDVLSQMKSTLILATQHSKNQFQQQGLANITQGVAALLQQRSQGTMNVSSDSQGINDHLKALRGECHKVSAGISNPVTRYGFENMMNTALFQFQKDFKLVTRETALAGQNLPWFPSQLQRPKSREDLRRLNIEGQEHTVQHPAATWALYMEAPAELNEPDDDAEEITPDHFQTIITFHPSQWLLRFGLSFGIQVLLGTSNEGLNWGLKS
ncbi:hypothetical protein ONS95_014695 [Cadophora gregata]|uniref:uncharacterized protein n=1 Tax=Cadophora gregata TaxID=51156 RepID=UPI0026DD953C|nr:uncharacterized protein ONS95_014695 [Cadophora gregata]KAK0112981.1 hypothetical protein ONS95_014695 [Cadophora gregata]KAK0125104.1 hypothetical protein ONS96_008971 [Cadophora gregata f. sp. sojae]